MQLAVPGHSILVVICSRIQADSCHLSVKGSLSSQAQHYRELVMLHSLTETVLVYFFLCDVSFSSRAGNNAFFSILSVF